VARAQAEGVRLDTRIAEAQQASVDGDAPAAEAALAAYSVIVAEALQGTDGDSTADAAIVISISRHVVVLNQLAGTVPAHARGAIEKAIASSSKAIEDLNGQTAPGDDGHAGGPDWLGGAAAPGATESTRPSQDTGPRASAGIDGIAAPGETGTPDKVPSPRDHEVPPGRSRGGGRDETGKSAHPTAAPSGPQGTPAGTQPGGPSAP
jgi:hypothetical protein